MGHWQACLWDIKDKMQSSWLLLHHSITLWTSQRGSSWFHWSRDKGAHQEKFSDLSLHEMLNCPWWSSGREGNLRLVCCILYITKGKHESGCWGSTEGVLGSWPSHQIRPRDSMGCDEADGRPIPKLLWFLAWLFPCPEIWQQQD